MAAFQSLKPIFVFSRIFGLFPFDFEKSTCNLKTSKKYLYYSYFLFFIIILTQIYVFWCTNHFYNRKFLTVSGVVSLSSLFAVFISSSWVFHAIIIRINTFRSSLNDLNNFLCCLGDGSYESIKRLYVFGLAVVSSFLLANAHFKLQTPKDRYLPNVDSSNFYLIFSTELICYYFNLWEIKIFTNYFFIFVKLLHEYFLQMNNIILKCKKFSDGGFRLKFVKELKNKHFKLINFTDFLHYYFGVVVTLQIIWTFLTTLTTIASSRNAPLFLKCFWVFYVVWDITLVFGICQATTNESEKMTNHIHTMLINFNEPELKEEIETFSLQLQHNKIEFTACGFFNLNLKLLYSMIGATTSYIILLVQFESDAEVKSPQPTSTNYSLH